jgi:hypothetical protein
MDIDIVTDIAAIRRRLDPALRDHLILDGPIPVVSHPLVVLPAMVPDQANERYHRQLERYTRLLDARDYEGLLHVVERPYRLSTLRDLFGEGMLDVVSLRKILGWAWTDAEPADELEWLPLWKAAAPIFERRLPSDSMTIYRGQIPGEPIGIAWSLDRDIAVFFATRFERGGTVLRGVIGRSRVLGYLVSRGESEIVCNPVDLSNIGPDG